MTDSRKPPTGPDRPPAPIDPDLESGPAEIEPGASNKPLPVLEDGPEVGLSQKGSGEDAIIRRETEI